MAKPMIYLTGRGGQLATELEQLLPEAKAFSREEWDITNAEQTSAHLDLNLPKLVINCAAYNFVDKAEEEPEIANAVNHLGPKLLAEACAERKIFFIHVSSDFIFGPESFTGRPLTVDSKPDPESVYAKSKLAGEKAVLEHANVAVVRTSWVYSSHGANFMKTILRLAADPNRDKLTIVEDQIGRPTRARSLAKFIVQLVEHQDVAELGSKLYHFSNTGVASWYDFAHEIVRIAHHKGLLENKIPVLPIPTEAYPLPAKRPSYSVMDLSSALTIQESIPHWKEDLAIELQNMV